MDPREARTCRLPPATVEADDLQGALRAWADAVLRRDQLRERIEHQTALLRALGDEHEAAKIACIHAQRRVETLNQPTTEE